MITIKGNRVIFKYPNGYSVECSFSPGTLSTNGLEDTVDVLKSMVVPKEGNISNDVEVIIRNGDVIVTHEFADVFPVENQRLGYITAQELSYILYYISSVNPRNSVILRIKNNIPKKLSDKLKEVFSIKTSKNS
jgi:hypothetical protein